LILVLCTIPVYPQQVANESPSPKIDECEKASRELFGQSPNLVGDSIKVPKRIRYVRPEFPELPPGTLGSGIWRGAVLIGPDGRIHKVSVIHDIEFEPPFPKLSDAISVAIHQWEYSPTIVDGEPVPVCMVVSVNINWR
jgi:hypothetical protein